MIDPTLAFLTGSPADWIILMGVALVLLGPAKLPEVGRQLGQAMREFQKIKDELTGTAQSIKTEVESAYQPIVESYSQDHHSSSPTVDRVTGAKTYDQEPVDLMAPVVPQLSPNGEISAPVLAHAEDHAVNNGATANVDAELVKDDAAREDPLVAREKTEAQI